MSALRTERAGVWRYETRCGECGQGVRVRVDDEVQYDAWLVTMSHREYHSQVTLSKQMMFRAGPVQEWMVMEHALRKAARQVLGAVGCE